MAQKRYQLSAAAQANTFYFVGGLWKFKVGICKTVGADKVLVRASDCPIHSASASDVVAANDEWCQRFMDNMKIPGGPIVNGTPSGAGQAVWDDVTGTTVPGDVTIDLDALQG